MLNVLQITHDYYGSKVYKKLFSSLTDVNSTVVVPLDKSNNSLIDQQIINIPLNRNRFQAFKSAKTIVNRLEKEIDLKKIDIVHAHFIRDGITALYLKRKYNIPYVVSIRQSCFNLLTSKVFYRRWIFKMVIKSANEVVFISNSLKKKVLDKLTGRLKSYVGIHSIVIPNGVDEYWLDNLYDKKRSIHDPIRVLSVGEVSINKNQLIVAKVIDELNKDGGNYIFLVAGKIVDKEVYEGLKGYPFVEYLGQKNALELKDIYRQADIFVLVSLRETFGVVYLEALSQGLPVIYTRNEGFDGWFIDEDIGVAVNPNSLEEIKKAILLYSCNCKEEVINRRVELSKSFNYSDLVNHYIKMYTRLCVK